MFDYQKVRLISVTKPVAEEFMNYVPELGSVDGDAEDLISYCARVSNPKNQTNFDTSSKLLKYCIDNKHWSVFEMVNVVFEIDTTRDIGRQILRHGTAKFQEFSQRYAEVPIDENFARDGRLQDTKNRQNSISLDASSDVNKEWRRRQNRLMKIVKEDYEWAIEQGFAKECARVVLPEGLTMSTMYMNNSLRNWIHYVELRTKNGTQLEHIDIGLKIEKILMEEFNFLKDYWA